MSIPEFTFATLLVLLFASPKLAWFPAVVTDGPDASLGTILSQRAAAWRRHCRW